MRYNNFLRAIFSAIRLHTGFTHFVILRTLPPHSGHGKNASVRVPFQKQSLQATSNFIFGFIGYIILQMFC